MTGRALLLRRLEAVEAAHLTKVEAAKRENMRAALLTLPPDRLRALKEDREAVKDPQARAAGLEAVRVFYAGRLEEVEALRGAALWCREAGQTQPGQLWPTPAPHFAALMEAHALRLWAAQDRADTPEARHFFRYGAASLQYRAALMRVLGGPA